VTPCSGAFVGQSAGGRRHDRQPGPRSTRARAPALGWEGDGPRGVHGDGAAFARRASSRAAARGPAMSVVTKVVATTPSGSPVPPTPVDDHGRRCQIVATSGMSTRADGGRRGPNPGSRASGESCENTRQALGFGFAVLLSSW
jgi:hypothetical protein